MKKISYILIFLLSSFFVFAQKGNNIDSIINNPPVPAKLVNDYANILTEDQKQTLERKLVALDDSTFTQITVVIVKSLDGKGVDDAAIELGRKWGVGNKKNNSGVVLLISKDDRKLNISPGYGLEGALTDVEASHIIDDVIVPKFKGDDYYRGISDGVDAIYQAVHGVYNTPREKRISGGSILPFIIIVIVLLALFAGGGGGGKGTFMSRRGTRGLAETIFWTNVLGGGGRGGGGGWGGGGSSGGGGFGGFGGGSFGGGGASGSW